MIPAYQRNELEYDNRIKKKINSLLAKKYTNTEMIRFEENDKETDDLFIQIEKILYLIYSLLQESHVHLFSIGLGASDSNNNAKAPLKAKKGRPQVNATNEHIKIALEQNTHATAKALGGISNFKSQMNQIVKMGLTFKKAVTQITPLFNYLNDQQVESIDTLIDNVNDIYNNTYNFLQNELANAIQIGAELKDLDIVTTLINKVNSEIINPNTSVLLQLVATYNPISTPIQQPTVNTNATGDGYTLDQGHFIGNYI